MNDVLSLKKEIKSNCVINMVPVLYRAGKPWDKIVPYLMTEFHSSVARLDQAGAALEKMTATDPDLCQTVKKFVDGHRMNCMGNVLFS
jgi:hypothetical protein